MLYTRHSIFLRHQLCLRYRYENPLASSSVALKSQQALLPMKMKQNWHASRSLGLKRVLQLNRQLGRQTYRDSFDLLMVWEDVRTGLRQWPAYVEDVYSGIRTMASENLDLTPLQCFERTLLRKINQVSISTLSLYNTDRNVVFLNCELGY